LPNLCVSIDDDLKIDDFCVSYDRPSIDEAEFRNHCSVEIEVEELSHLKLTTVTLAVCSVQGRFEYYVFPGGQFATHITGCKQFGSVAN
jgi:hypothetical protein